MARRPQFSDEHILEAAREVFLARGVSATTAEVAERAGVSEGTLFHHFKTKGALFRAALEVKLEEPARIGQLASKAGKGEVEENLREFGTAVLEWLRIQMPVMMLAYSSANPEQRPQVVCEFEPAYSRLIRSVAAYLDAEARHQRIRRIDPEIAARAFIGGISDYVRSEILGMNPQGLPLPAPMFVRGLVDLFIYGAANAPQPARAAVKRAR